MQTAGPSPTTSARPSASTAAPDAGGGRRPRRRVAEPGALHWQEYAACLRVDVSLFFAPDPVDEPARERLRRLVAAKRICAACPVRETCRGYALENAEEFGVWGGLSETERKHLLAERRRARRQ